MQVTCPACQKTLQSQADLTGKSIKCKCGNTFMVGAPDAATQAPSAKITVSCSCGKTLQAPASAAGKAVKCPCGQLIKVPAGAASPAAKPAAIAKPAVAAAAATTATRAPAVAHTAAVARPAPVVRRPAPTAAGGAPNPFGDMSDEEWQGLVAKHAPRKPTEQDNKPKVNTATENMLEEARKDTNQGKSMLREGAEGHLDQSRWLLVGLGVVLLAYSAFQLFMLNGMLESMASAAERAGDEEFDREAIRMVLMILGGFAVSVSVIFMLLGFFIFLLPLTCSVSALLLYICLELVRILSDPLDLLSIRSWIIRGAIFGGLIQAINNAAYYRFVKKQEKEERKARQQGR
jgi:hypothetical protein